MRALRILWLVGALAGCAWVPSYVPLLGRDEPTSAEAAEPETASPESAGSGICRRKGRLWPEGSRVCEEHTVTRCFSDGDWHVIGAC